MGLTDLHCHLLWGIDDGPKNLAETLAMVTAAQQQGITQITVSPHFNPSYQTTRQQIIAQTQQLQAEISQQGLALQVFPSQEIRIYDRILEDLQKGQLLTVGDLGRQVLIEFPSDHAPQYAARIFRQLLDAGIQPILVHPERNAGLLKKPSVLTAYLELGVSLQVTAASLTGHFGKKIQKFSHQLMKQNAVTFIASDAHNLTSRTFKMQEAYALIAKKYGQAKATQLQENAAQLLLK